MFAFILVILISVAVTYASTVYHCNRKTTFVIKSFQEPMQRHLTDAWKQGYESGKFTGVTMSQEDRAEFFKTYAANR